MRPLRILLIQDDGLDVRNIEQELERGGFEPTSTLVGDEAGLSAELLARGFDLILSDFSLRQIDALEVLRVTRQLAPELPVIIVANDVGQEPAIAAMRAGARDVVPRHPLDRLLTAVERELEDAGERGARTRADVSLRVSEARYRSLFEGVAISLWDGDVSQMVDWLERLREGGVQDFRLHFDENPDLLFEALRRVEVVDVNEATLSLFGAPDKKTLYDSFPDGVGREVPVGLSEAVLALAEGRSFFESEISLPTLAGDTREMWMTGSILETRGAGTRFLVSFTDLTERRRAEEALRASEEQFRHAQKMEAVGQLAGGVAHDFNNLLTVIAGHTELMLMDLPSASPYREPIREIVECQERAATLTQQLLVFSCRQVHRPKVIDLNEAVNSTARMLERLIGETVGLVTGLEQGLPAVYIDPGHLDQILINLVLNARDAMPDGGRIDLETRLLEGGTVELTIRDTGSGMAGETLARAFEPFFTTKELGQGSGLGLSTVYGIVKQSDGTISVDSKQGVGTCFQIRLPSARSAATAFDATAARMETKPSSTTETILVVEDETSVRRIVQQALERSGYRVLTARNGEEALEVANSRHPTLDLIVADLVMPRMGGRELAIKLHESQPALKVLFMSGYAGPPVSDELALELGCGLLQKPFSLLELTRKVDEVIAL